MSSDEHTVALTGGGGDGGRIARYALHQKIGEGGMGEVWLAEQTEPIRRRVALKFVKSGIDPKLVIGRFESERQALALMDHPSIARVFDAGATREGRPYFAMEYVPGVPITEHCDKSRLTIHERLRLFLKVCAGVQHAHQKAIIHRDLKPSNVLVTLLDGQDVPKIIDFGVAKAMGPRLTERTLFTELGVLVGTPGYVSPEQADPGAQDIDTRTDVYALGVMLYELLVGAPPFDARALVRDGVGEMLRRIRDEEPTKPSTRVGAMSGTSNELARLRRLDPTIHRRALRGDLDWITMKALEKDRARRYGSPAELAADIERHLAHLPVLAGPPSAAYRAGRFILRHRFGVAATAGFVILLAALAISQSIQARRTARERDRANLEATTAKRTADFLVRVFEVSDPGETRGNSVTAREILDRSLSRLDSDLVREPVMSARLALTMSRVYEGLGLYEPAQRLAERSWEARRNTLGPDDAATLESRSQLGDLLRLQDKRAEARAHLKETLDIQRRTVGPEALPTLVTENRYGAALYTDGDLETAETALRHASDGLRRAGLEGERELTSALVWLGEVLRERDRRAEAADVLREALEISTRINGGDAPDTLSALDALGLTLWDLGRLDEAEANLRASLEASRKVLGQAHPDTLTTALNLGLVLNDRGKFGEATEAFRAALDGYRKTLGPEHAHTLTAKSCLCGALREAGELTEAETFCREALAGRRRVLGEDHPSTLQAWNAMGALLQSAGRPAEAESFYREAYGRRLRVLGPDHASTLISMGNLGDVLVDQGRYREAADLLGPAAARARKTLPPTDSMLASLVMKWGRCLAKLHRIEEARSTLTEAGALFVKSLGPDHPATKKARDMLADLR